MSANYWDADFTYNPNNDPWADATQWTEKPNGWQYTGKPAEPTERTHTPDCGRCGGYTDDGGIMFHLRWECTAQEAWIETAINDRKASPDRYRQAKKDLGAGTLKEAREKLEALKAA